MTSTRHRELVGNMQLKFRRNRRLAMGARDLGKILKEIKKRFGK